MPAPPVMALASPLPVSVCPVAAVPVRFSTLAIAGEAVARERGSHLVGARARRLGDDVAQAVDDVGVVAGAADHGVVAGAAVERVVAAVAVQHVVAAQPRQAYR